MANELLVLFILTLSIICSLFLLLIYLILRKAAEIKKRQKINQFKETYNSHILMLLTDRNYTFGIAPKTLLEQKAIEELLSRYSKILEGADEKKRLSELAESFLSNYYQKQLKSIRWSIRMNTLYHIEDFEMINLLTDVSQLLKKRKPSHAELVHVLRILGLFQFPHMLELLTIQFIQLSEYEYQNILLRLETKQFDQFVLHFHKSRQTLQKAILEVMSIKREISYLSFLENIFSSYSGEIRLRALKALANIGYVKKADSYLELLYSTKWEERMVAAKLIGTLREEKGISRLIELLHDPSWWVRSQAGQAISQFVNGKEILYSILDTSKDVFAKDMAWEWLHKGV